MNAQEIATYLQMLGDELQHRGVTGEIVLVGGAVMLLVIGNRPVTKDVDVPPSQMLPRIQYLIQSLFP